MAAKDSAAALAKSRIVKALWPPILGWVPVGIVSLAMPDANVHRDALALVITLICVLVALVFCVVNVVGLVKPCGMQPRLRVALPLLNLSFPLAFAAAVVHANW